MILNLLKEPKQCLDLFIHLLVKFTLLNKHVDQRNESYFHIRLRGYPNLKRAHNRVQQLQAVHRTGAFFLLKSWVLNYVHVTVEDVDVQNYVFLAFKWGVTLLLFNVFRRLDGREFKIQRFHAPVQDYFALSIFLKVYLVQSLDQFVDDHQMRFWAHLRTLVQV